MNPSNDGEPKRAAKKANRFLGGIYLSSLCYELELLFRAGISAADGVAILAAGETGRKQKEVLNGAAVRLAAGIPFSEAFGQTGAFPKYMIDMLRIGEETGRLEETLSSLSEYYDRRERLTRTVRYAVAYPSVLAALMLAVAVILITRVLPVFGEITLLLGARQNAAAKAMTEAGRFISANIVWLVPLAVALGAAAAAAAVATLRRGSVGRSIAAARFASAMAMGMSSGLETDKSLDLAEMLCSGTYAGPKIAACREAMRNGEPFPEAVASTGLFNDLYNRMLAVGFRTGSADAAMREIARRHEELAAERTEAAAGRLEPTLVIIMALLVGFILLSVMIPLMSIMSAL